MFAHIYPYHDKCIVSNYACTWRPLPQQMQPLIPINLCLIIIATHATKQMNTFLPAINLIFSLQVNFIPFFDLP